MSADPADPVELGMTMHQPLMMLVKQLNPTSEQFIAIARLTDILVGSAQVHTARHGLGPVAEEAYVEMVRDKLESLGLMKAGPEQECTCTIDGTPHCKARGTGNCKAETPGEQEA